MASNEIIIEVTARDLILLRVARRLQEGAQ
jgi:hypothetical protein